MTAHFTFFFIYIFISVITQLNLMMFDDVWMSAVLWELTLGILYLCRQQYPSVKEPHKQEDPLIGNGKLTLTVVFGESYGQKSLVE